MQHKTQPALTRIFTLKLIILLAGFSGNALASAFCSVIDKQKNCNFDTLKMCQLETGDKGYCTINPNEGQTQAPSLPGYAVKDQRLMENILDGRTALNGSGSYCVETPNSLNCHYQDFTSCQNAAGAQGGQCRINPQR